MTLPVWVKELPAPERLHLLTVLISQSPMWDTRPELRNLYNALVSQPDTLSTA